MKNGLHSWNSSPPPIGDICSALTTSFLHTIEIKNLTFFQDFSRLLQSLAVYDVCYLVLNLPAFVAPALSGDDINDNVIHAWPYISPLLQICLTGLNSLRANSQGSGRWDCIVYFSTNTFTIKINCIAIILNIRNQIWLILKKKHPII